MKRILLCLIAVPLFAAYTPESLVKELERLRLEIDKGNASRVLSELPESWDVDADEERYSISTSPLQKMLAGGGSEATNWIDSLAENLRENASSALAGETDAKDSLAKILARPEFAAERPPSAWTQFTRKLGGWILDVIQTIMGYAAQHPTGSRILFWTVLIGAVVAIAAFVFRLWTRDQQLIALPKMPAPAPELRTWQQWINSAREAADRGDLREAIRYAYWAGIARLQEARALPADLRLTPRECLRDVKQDAYRPALSSLTSNLERFWYGRRPASAENFRNALHQLENLGCKVD